MGGETRRLFFALWPDGVTREALARYEKQLGRRSGGRPVTSANLHLTLAFLGSVEAECQACLESMAGQIEAPPFELLLDQAGFWRRPRVLWLGARETPEPLRELVRQLNLGLAGCGLTPENRPFQAHITLRRKALRHPEATEFTPLYWPVREFVLVESQTRPEGACYQVVGRWPLAVAGG